MAACVSKAEVYVCEHVLAGQAYDFLGSVSDDGTVDGALCYECATVLFEMMDRAEGRVPGIAAYSDAELQDAHQRFREFIGAKDLCRRCARDLHIPDKTPNGEYTWHRPVQ